MKADICLLCRREVKLGYREIVGEDFEYTCRKCANQSVRSMESRLNLVREVFR